MAKYYIDTIPKPGSKIAYMINTKDIHYTVAYSGEEKDKLIIFNNDFLKENMPIYLSEYTPWSSVLLWWYEDKNYNYGKEL